MELRHEYRYIDDETIEFIINSKKHGERKVLIDAKNKERVFNHQWHLAKSYTSPDNATFYPRRNVHGANGKSKTTQTLHRFLISVSKGKEIDHMDGDPLNNRESNLRMCTRSQNQQNKRIQKNNTSGFKGVYHDISNGKATPWKAWCRYDGRGQKFLGRYSCREEAALAYDEEVLKSRKIVNPERQFNFPNGPSKEILKIIKDSQERVKEERQSKYTSKYWGVRLVKHPYHERYYAAITVKYKSIHLGCFKIEEQAAEAFDKAAIINRGPNTKLNFPKKLEEYLAEIEKERNNEISYNINTNNNSYAE